MNDVDPQAWPGRWVQSDRRASKPSPRRTAALELEARRNRDPLRRGLTLAPVNKVHHVRTIARVAEMLGEDEDWLWDVANEMDQEDGLIWVYGLGDEGVMAFTDFGIENLVDLVEMHKADPDLLKRSSDPK